MPRRYGAKKTRRPYAKRSSRRMPFRRGRRPPMSRAGSKITRIVPFKRTDVSDLVLNVAAAPTGWTSLLPNSDNALVFKYVVDLAQISGYTNWTSLFDQYRIKGVRLQGYLSFSNTGPDSQSSTILYTCRDQDGSTAVTNLSEQYFLDRPRSNKRILQNDNAKPAFDIYMPLNNLGNVYGGTVLNTDYTLKKPKFISTSEVTTPYYGLNMRLQRIDGNNWTTGTANQYPTLKMYRTVYFQMRGVNS